jgi:hypothetical protein
MHAIRWLGPENCAEVFAALGCEHSDDEDDHTRIRGLGASGDQTAYWGDTIQVYGDGSSHVVPEEIVRVSRTQLDELFAEVEELRAEVNPLRDAGLLPAKDLA